MVLSAHGVRDDGYWNTADYEVRVTLDGSNLSPQPGISMRLESLSAGQHVATMRIADGAGRLSAPRSTTFSVDGAGPALSITSPAENARVRRGANLDIAIEAADAQGVMRVKLYLDRISDDEFDSTSLGVFPGVFGVGRPERRETTVTANWPIGSHTLIAVATDVSGAMSWVERTFQVAVDSPGDFGPGRLPEQRRYPDPRQRIQPARTRIMTPAQARDALSRQNQSGNAFPTRRQSTLIFPTQQTQWQSQTNQASEGARQRSTQSIWQQSHGIHSVQGGGRQEFRLPANVTKQKVDSIIAQSSIDRRKLQPVNGKVQAKIDPWKAKASVNSAIQKKLATAALQQRTATASSEKKNQQAANAKAKVDQMKVQNSASDQADSSETNRESKLEHSHLSHKTMSASKRRGK